MKPESFKYLYDITYSISLIEEFIGAYNFFDYHKDLKTKSAVERQLAIIGEAVNHYKKEETVELEYSKQIIAFRNRIIHAYDNIDDEIVWVIIKNHIPKLKDEINKIIAKSS